MNKDQECAINQGRRTVLKGLTGIGLGVITGLWRVSDALAASKKVTMGFIYVGPRDDYGYNQAHFEGKSAIAKQAWVKAVDQENVPETIAVQKAMESMINLDGAQVIFPTSFGYFDPHILKIAPKYPEVMFLHCGGLYDASKHPKNVGSYFGYIDEAVYVSGIVAGHMSKTGKLGYIAAIPIPQVLRNINSFTMAARRASTRAAVNSQSASGSVVAAAVSSEFEYQQVRWCNQYWRHSRRPGLGQCEPLVTYKVSPFSVLYVGSTTNYAYVDNFEDEPAKWRLVSRQFFMKLKYLFQT